MMENIEDRIRRRAYEIWEREGRPHGREIDHWLRAAQEIAGEEGRGGDMAMAAGSEPAAGARKPAARTRRTGAKEPSAQLAQPAAAARAEQSIEHPSGRTAGEPGAKAAPRRATRAKAGTAPATPRSRRGPGESG